MKPSLYPPVSMSRRLPGNKATLTHYRIDAEHSNAYEAWRKMGSPQNPTKEQIESLEKAGKLHKLEEPQSVKITKGKTVIKFTLPRQGVSLLKFASFY